MKLCGKKLYSAKGVKYLGVKININLSWQCRINELYIKLNRASNKQSLFQRYGAWMTMFSKNLYFIIIQCFEFYTTLILEELLYNKKSNFLLLFQKVS